MIEFTKDDRDERQAQVADWVCRSFSPEIQASVPERVERLYEEVCELAQAEGAVGGVLHGLVGKLIVTYDEYQGHVSSGGSGDPLSLVLVVEELRETLKIDRLSTIAHRVYQKPKGVLAQEVGGISTTLLAYCESRGLSADFCEKAELERILSLPPDHFKAKQVEKVASGMAVDRTSQPTNSRLDPTFIKVLDSEPSLKCAEGCCSSTSPCTHQKTDPSSLCGPCQDAADATFLVKTLAMTEPELDDAIRAEGLNPNKVVEDMREGLSATIEMFRRMTTAEAKLHQIHSQYIVNRGDMTAEEALRAIKQVCTRLDNEENKS